MSLSSASALLSSITGEEDYEDQYDEEEYDEQGEERYDEGEEQRRDNTLTMAIWAALQRGEEQEVEEIQRLFGRADPKQTEEAEQEALRSARAKEWDVLRQIFSSKESHRLIIQEEEAKTFVVTTRLQVKRNGEEEDDEEESGEEEELVKEMNIAVCFECGKDYPKAPPKLVSVEIEEDAMKSSALLLERAVQQFIQHTEKQLQSENDKEENDKAFKNSRRTNQLQSNSSSPSSSASSGWPMYIESSLRVAKDWCVLHLATRHKQRKEELKRRRLLLLQQQQQKAQEEVTKKEESRHLDELRQQMRMQVVRDSLKTDRYRLFRSSKEDNDEEAEWKPEDFRIVPPPEQQGEDTQKTRDVPKLRFLALRTLGDNLLRFDSLENVHSAVKLQIWKYLKTHFIGLHPKHVQLLLDKNYRTVSWKGAYWDDAHLVGLARSCQNLVKLVLKDCVKLTDVSLGEVASHCNKLQHVVINRCSIQGSGIVQMSKRCPLLSYVNLSHNAGLDGDAVLALLDNCPLTYLDVSFCRSSSIACLASPTSSKPKTKASCNTLETLLLEGAPWLASAHFLRRVFGATVYSRLWRLNVCDTSVLNEKQWREVLSAVPNLRRLEANVLRRGVETLALSAVAELCPFVVYLELVCYNCSFRSFCPPTLTPETWRQFSRSTHCFEVNDIRKVLLCLKRMPRLQTCWLWNSNLSRCLTVHKELLQGNL
ncbi:hypothetical protein QOT17_016012 [Balamuthia mandrillaris]